MTIIAFPPVESADENGLLAVGGDLEVQSLLLAYQNGIFPWPIAEQLGLTWFSPPERAVLFVDAFCAPRSLKKTLRRDSHSIGVDCDFPRVIRCCADSKNRGSQRGTWITPGIVDAYIELHHAGYCHSIECYDDQGLSGGLYGVSIGRMFAGESMFYLRDNASKICAAFLIDYLRRRGVEWLDCQLMTPFIASLGAVELARRDFLSLLRPAVEAPMRLFDDISGKRFSAGRGFAELE